MKSFSIVKAGADYVVRAEDREVLKLSSKRNATKLVTDANALLRLEASPIAEIKITPERDS